MDEKDTGGFGVLPIGLFYNLNVHPDAMDQYMGMNEEQKHTVQAKSRHVTSRQEMEDLVRMVAEGKFE